MTPTGLLPAGFSCTPPSQEQRGSASSSFQLPRTRRDTPLGARWSAAGLPLLVVETGPREARIEELWASFRDLQQHVVRLDGQVKAQRIIIHQLRQEMVRRTSVGSQVSYSSEREQSPSVPSLRSCWLSPGEDGSRLEPQYGVDEVPLAPRSRTIVRLPKV